MVYTQTKKTVNAENIPGMCVLTNRARDLVTAENERVSQSWNRVGSRIVLKGLKIKSSSLSYRNLNYYSFLSESHMHYASENMFVSAFGE